MRIPLPSWPRHLTARTLGLAALLLAGRAGHAQTTAYCATGLGGSCGGSDITDVGLSGTTLNATGLTCVGTGGQAYTSYPATGANTATLSGGVPYTLSVTLTGISIVAVWIDYNHNFVYEASEWTQVTTSSTIGVPAAVSVLVPSNAVQGQTGMRIRSRAAGNANGPGDACTNFGSGETKDFTVTIGAPAACPSVSGVTVTGITATGASVGFTPIASATSYTVTVTPATGTPSTQTVSTSPATLTGLTASTRYTVGVVANCGAGGSSAAFNATFTTGCSTAPYAAVNNTTPYTQDFEATWLSQCGTRDVPAVNWRNTPVTGDNSWRREDDGASANWTGPTFGAYTPTGSPLGTGTSAHSARFHSYNANSRSTGFLDLYVNMAGTSGTPTLNFDYINTSGTDSLKVYVSTNGGTSFSATPLAGLNLASAWTRQTVSLPTTGLTATTIIRLRASADFGLTDIGLDNVQVSYITCPAVAGLTATSITATGATIGFTPATAATTYTVTITPANGTPTTQTTTTSPVTLTGLTASTSYTVSIVGNCGTNGSSVAATVTFATACTAAPYVTVTSTTPYTQDFEAAWLSQCGTNDVPTNNWRNTPVTGDNSWRREDDGASANWSSPSSGSYTPAGSPLGTGTSAHSARFHSYNAPDGSAGLLDLYVNMAGTSGTPTLNFDHINTSGTDSLKVYVSTNGGASFGRALASFTTAATWTRRTITLPATGLTATTVVRLRAVGDFGFSDIGIDNVLVSYIACPALNSVAVSGITATGATLTFTPTSAASYTVTVTPTGGTPTTVTPAPTTSPITLTGLTASTAYTVSVVGNCGAGQTSAATTATFTTACVAAPYVAVNNTTPYTQDFEATWLSQCGTRDVPAVNWRNTPVTGNNSWRREDDGASAAWTGPTSGAYTPAGSPLGTGTSAHSARFHSYNVSGRATGALDLYVNMAGTSGTPTLSFDYINTSGSDSLKVFVSTNGGSTFSAVLGGFGVAATWARQTVNLPATGLTATTIVRLRAVGDFGLTDIGLDNVSLAYVACPAVSGLSATAVTTTAATVNFTPGPASTTYTLTITPAGGTAITRTATTSPVSLTGLTPGTAYTVSIVSNCSSTQTSQPAVFSFSTLAVAPANDDCAGALNVPIQFGSCVGQTATDNTAATGSTGVAAPTCASYSGGDVWFKVTVPISGSVEVQTVAPTAGSSITDTGMSIYSGTCGTLTEVDCDDDDGSGNYSLISLTGRTPGEVLYIRVWAYNGGNTGLLAVCVTTPSNCAAPTAPTSSNVTNTTATVSWVAPANPPAGATFELEYGPQGFTQGTGTTITGLTTTSSVLTGLTPNTPYCYYVRQNCGTTNGSSAYVGPTCFTTPLTIPLNDEPCGATALGAGPLTSTTSGATTSAQQPGINLPTCSSAQLPKDVWFAFTPAATTSTLTLTGAPAGNVRLFASPNCSAGPFAELFCQASPGNNTAFAAPIALTGLTPGTRYYLAVSGYGSADNTGSFTIAATNLVLATKAQAETDALLVYPNPSSSGQLTLRLSGLTGTGQLALLNALGQVVLAKALATATPEHTLSTRGLAPGLYTLRLSLNGKAFTRKVVLE